MMMLGFSREPQENYVLPHFLVSEAAEMGRKNGVNKEVIIQRAFVSFLEKLQHEDVTIFPWVEQGTGPRSNYDKLNLAQTKLSEVLGNTNSPNYDYDRESNYNTVSPLQSIKDLALELGSPKISARDIAINALAKYLGFIESKNASDIFSPTYSDIFSPTYKDHRQDVYEQPHFNKDAGIKIPARIGKEITVVSGVEINAPIIKPNVDTQYQNTNSIPKNQIRRDARLARRAIEITAIRGGFHEPVNKGR